MGTGGKSYKGGEIGNVDRNAVVGDQIAKCFLWSFWDHISYMITSRCSPCHLVSLKPFSGTPYVTLLPSSVCRWRHFVIQMLKHFNFNGPHDIVHTLSRYIHGTSQGASTSLCTLWEVGQHIKWHTACSGWRFLKLAAVFSQLSWQSEIQLCECIRSRSG